MAARGITVDHSTLHRWVMTMSYTPFNGDLGKDSFTYAATNGSRASARLATGAAGQQA